MLRQAVSLLRGISLTILVSGVMRTLVGALACLCLCSWHANAQSTITLGETAALGYLDNGNANLLLAQGPYGLTQAATIQSLSFYVVTTAGQIRLGIYDAGPNRNCTGGSLKAQTSGFSLKSNSWNTANVISQVQLPVGYYCLAYLPSSNNLSFRKGLTSGISEVNFSQSFGSLPAKFSSSPGGDPYHWSFYATLAPVNAPPPPPTLNIAFNPPNPTTPAKSPPGTVVAAIHVTWSNGQPFTGTVAFGPPNGSDGGTFAIDGNFNVIVASNGPGVAGDGNTVQNVTVVATQ
jgi:hypothetical protein